IEARLYRARPPVLLGEQPVRGSELCQSCLIAAQCRIDLRDGPGLHGVETGGRFAAARLGLGNRAAIVVEEGQGERDAESQRVVEIANRVSVRESGPEIEVGILSRDLQT